MKLGLFDVIGLATTLIFAIPVANFGVWRILDGEVAFGVALLVVAIAMVVIPQFFFDPGRIIRALIAGLLPRQLRPGGTERGESDANDGHGSGSSSPEK